MPWSGYKYLLGLALTPDKKTLFMVDQTKDGKNEISKVTNLN